MNASNVKTFIKTALLLPVSVVILCACQESLEDRAEREAKEYTSKFCPTPPENDVITDSVVFNKATRTKTYYYTFTENLDNEEILNENKDKIFSGLLVQVRSNPQNKSYIEAGFAFAYVCRSQSKGNVILERTFSSKELQGIEK